MKNCFWPFTSCTNKVIYKIFCNGFIESFYHSLHFFYNHEQNNKKRNKLTEIVWALNLSLLVYNTEEAQARVAV